MRTWGSSPMARTWRCTSLASRNAARRSSSVAPKTILRNRHVGGYVGGLMIGCVGCPGTGSSRTGCACFRAPTDTPWGHISAQYLARHMGSPDKQQQNKLSLVPGWGPSIARSRLGAAQDVTRSFLPLALPHCPNLPQGPRLDMPLDIALNPGPRWWSSWACAVVQGPVHLAPRVRPRAPTARHRSASSSCPSATQTAATA
jgi:hypothetical protein